MNIDCTSIEFKNLVNSSSKYTFKDIWHLYKSYWREIQHLLPNGHRICPKCGIILQKRFKSHLLQHQMSVKQWYDQLHNITAVKICPVCNINPLPFNDKQLTYNTCCSKECNQNSFIRKKQASINLKNTIAKYGNSACPKKWTDIQIKNRGYDNRSDIHYLQYIKDKHPQLHKEKQPNQLHKEKQPKLRVKKEPKAYLSRNPEKWTDEQIIQQGYLSRSDPRLLSLIEEKRLQRKLCASRAGKQNNIKNGSILAPGSWTDEQIIHRGYFGRTDPRYLELLSKKKNNCSKAGKENVKKYGFYGAPGSWTDEQLKNRGYTDRNDPRYLKKIQEKSNNSKKCGHITASKYKCSLNGWGYKIDFFFKNKLYKLDSMHELWFIITLIKFASDEQLLDNQHYYSNNTNLYNGLGARSDIRTYNSKTKIITNWEIHNSDDIDGINRKQYCTKLHKERFILISFKKIRRCILKLKQIGFKVDELKQQIQYSNKVLNIPYTLIYEEYL